MSKLRRLASRAGGEQGVMEDGARAVRVHWGRHLMPIASIGLPSGGHGGDLRV